MHGPPFSGSPRQDLGEWPEVMAGEVQAGYVCFSHRERSGTGTRLPREAVTAPSLTEASGQCSQTPDLILGGVLCRVKS